MTDSFPKFQASSVVAEYNVVDGDAYYTGNKRVEYVQPDIGNDGGYWVESDIPTSFSAPDTAQILERLDAIEKELKIRKK